MLNKSDSTATKLRVDTPSPRPFASGLRRFLTKPIDNGPALERLGELSIITLSEDSIPFKYQRREALRLMREIPVNRCRLIIDVAKFADEDSRLSRLIYDIVNEARRCRLNIYVGGISKKKEALLELTRVTQIVRCFSNRSEAIRACLQQAQTLTHRGI